MKRVLSIVIGFSLLVLCLVSAIRADALLKREKALNVPRALNAAPRHKLTIPPLAAAVFREIIR
ncbi:MAG TPA: hypothetical protein VFB33_08090 [Candidatus Binataceae bacterium]|nr:hypothetical protein [Candidatus Binataceae bacterium]